MDYARARMRSKALLHAGLGCFMAWSATVLGARVARLDPAVHDAAATPSAAPTPASGQTLVTGEPRRIGDAYDDDGALRRSADPIASYTLEARLDEVGHRIAGKGTIEWRNASSGPVPELRLHLYLNAFKNNRSLFAGSPFSAGRSGEGTKRWGYVDVKTLRVREMDGEDVWPRAANANPDLPDDETDLVVPLPRAVQPGERVHLDVEFEDVLPEIVERTGYSRDFHMIGQWFPKLSRLEENGTWASFPFHAQSEFYADFGSYDITLDVAPHLVVGATGARVEDTVVGGRRRLRYRAEDVHDFAWTAWEHFRERTERVGEVDVRVLFPPGNDKNAEVTLSAVRHGLGFFGKAFGRYPYRTLTVVHPPAFAPGASGMEYPTLITTGFPWYAGHASTLVERVTLHELGHQWFYGLVATNEHASPFLDEGLTTYAEGRAMDALFGDGSAVSLPGLAVKDGAYERVLAARAGHDDIVAHPAPSFVGFGALGALVYARTGTILSTLGRVHGDAKLDKALGRYARRYRFEHPDPRHLVSAVEEVMGEDAAEFLRLSLFQGGTIDLVAKDLRTTRAKPKAGVFGDTAHRTEVPEPASNADEGDEGDEWLGRVVVYRHGTLQVPVEVEFRFEDGTRVRKSWDGRAARASIECSGKTRVIGAVVDPDLRVLLDDDLTNNTALSGGGSAARLVERTLYGAELVLGGAGP